MRSYLPPPIIGERNCGSYNQCATTSMLQLANPDKRCEHVPCCVPQPSEFPTMCKETHVDPSKDPTTLSLAPEAISSRRKILYVVVKTCFYSINTHFIPNMTQSN
ncbi:hypothetical protein T265_03309 [Opisthorchis viverrini]|uniref:Uncharacterized protein n=1 Tax=Opisthorchis viverrini TaxID=6198 RepID=A0A075AHP8_OPIVI|nr:hypothetical protein T265_03309 [Opisthorchis viverrini]KER30259.1 hypothetical protein T265_03309 [Opisthorchis viverrini]